MENKALFIDRDGIINKMILQKNDSFDSPQSEDQVILVDGIIDLISFCNTNNIPVIEISNQPGVAKGKMTIETLESIENKVHSLLQIHGVHVDAKYRCLHHPNATNEEYRTECECRKPKPNLLFRAAKEMNIDLKKSIFLGDNITDVEAGNLAGCTPILFVHDNDEPHKIAANKTCEVEYCVSSHVESLALIKKLL